MATPTLDEKLTQLQLMGAPAFLAAWGAQHPAERAPVQAVLEALVDHELARRRERLRIPAGGKHAEPRQQN